MSKKLRIGHMARTFYVNEVIFAILSTEKDSKFLHSHEKFRKDFMEFRNKFAHKLAQILYDYIIFAAMDEMHEAWQECDLSPTHLLGYPIYLADDSVIKERIHLIDKKSFFEMCEYMYGKGDWQRLFGGDAWYKIIKICQYFGKISDIIFCDVVFDLEHNTGRLVNKDNPYFITIDQQLKDILNKKRYSTDPYDLFENFNNRGCYLNKEIYDIYTRFINLYYGKDKGYPESILHERRACKESLVEPAYLLFNYQPVEYTGYYDRYDIVFSYEVQDEYDKFCSGKI